MKVSSELNIGRAGEYLVLADLLINGVQAYDTGQGVGYDIVADVNGKLIRIQVKTTQKIRKITQRANPIYFFHIKRTGKNGNKFYEQKDFDCFALVQKEIEDKEEKYAGVCSHIKEKGTDILILLKKKPRTNKEYSALYHELYHAVEFIREDHGLDGGEASAYLYEFLIEKCNDYLWPKGENPNLVLSE